MKVLLWVVSLVPLAVLGIMASSVGQKEGMKVLISLIWLIVVVVVGLVCQVTWYLLQMAVFARMSPVRFLGGSIDVMACTFSTASTAATIPITLRSLQRLGISRQSSQLTACIGTNFNNDGTALYQATAVLFMAQALGYSLSLLDQVLIVLTTLVASVGAGGISSGSFVTLPLIFAAVHLPAEKIPILLTIDWFLDRCRTTSNVLGDMTVAVLLDRIWGSKPLPASQMAWPSHRRTSPDPGSFSGSPSVSRDSPGAVAATTPPALRPWAVWVKARMSRRPITRRRPSYAARSSNG